MTGAMAMAMERAGGHGRLMLGAAGLRIEYKHRRLRAGRQGRAGQVRAGQHLPPEAPANLSNVNLGSPRLVAYAGLMHLRTTASAAWPLSSLVSLVFGRGGERCR